MRIFLLFTFILAFFSLNAQQVLLERNPAVDTTKDKTGPNRLHFVHAYIGGGAVTGEKNPGARLKLLGNYNLVLGARYKLRVNDFYALGLDASVANMVINLRQEKGKFIPDTILHKRERLNWMYLNLGFFNRINFYKRGNILGNYLDLGAMISYCPSFVHYTMDKTADGRSLRIRERGLNYYNNFTGAVYARLGLNRFAISVSYRLTPLFKSTYNWPNIAPVNVTIEVALY